MPTLAHARQAVKAAPQGASSPEPGPPPDGKRGTASEYLPSDAEAAASPESSRATGAGSGGGWFPAMRTPEALELARTTKLAFILAYFIGCGAQFRAGWNKYNLAQGEALLGDFKSYGMTRQQYRTAQAQLKKWGFATFKTTNKGTIGKLIDTRLFALNGYEANQQNNQRVTSSQPAANQQPTTSNKGIREEGKKGENGPPAGNREKPISDTERVSAEKEIERIDRKLQQIENNSIGDAFGPKYSAAQREERNKLKSRKKSLLDRLGSVV
jgi:hypothetical protein